MSLEKRPLRRKRPPETGEASPADSLAAHHLERERTIALIARSMDGRELLRHRSVEDAMENTRPPRGEEMG